MRIVYNYKFKIEKRILSSNNDINRDDDDDDDDDDDEDDRLVVACVFCGLSLNVSNLGGDVYLNFF